MTIKTRILILGLLATFLLVCVAGFILVDEYRDKTDKTELFTRLERVQKLSVLINELQRERGISAGYLAGTQGFDINRLQHQQTSTKQARDRLDDAASDNFEELKLLDLTQKRIGDRELPPADSFAWYSLAVTELLDRIDSVESRSNRSILKRELHAYSHLLLAKEHLGQMRAGLTEFLAQKDHAKGSVAALGRQLGLYHYHGKNFQHDAAVELREAYSTVHANPQAQAVFTAIDDAIKGNKLSMTADEWFATATAVIDDIGQLENQSLSYLRNKVIREIEGSEKRLWLVLFVTIGVCVVFLLVTATTVYRLLFALGNLVASIRHTIGTRDFSNRIPDAGQDELTDIACNFNELLSVAEQLIQEKDCLASTDFLTGAVNRRKFPELFANELQTQSDCENQANRLSMITFDIDHFKQVNDSLGHAIGDSVLKEMACLARGLIRKTDVLARWGGEEFMILAPSIGLETAEQLAEKLRSAIERHDFAGGIKATASFGVSEFRSDDTLESICKRADAALYVAKNTGRNRVCLEKNELSGFSGSCEATP